MNLTFSNFQKQMTPMRRALLLLILAIALLIVFSKPADESPFTYPFVKEVHLERPADAAYSEYKAFYLLTEDFEPIVTTAADIDEMRAAMRFAAELSARYQIPWTHFVDVNTLAPAFIAEDATLRQRSRDMIDDLKGMIAHGDDCQLHLHGALDSRLLAAMRQTVKLHSKCGIGTAQPYRQRRSFFFNAFYAEGYRNIVVSLTYGKRLLEQNLYDGKQTVLAFRPGGWDHGSSSQDTRLYYKALMAAGLIANSGLSTGNFASANWRVGNDIGHNLATVTVDNKTITEVSPTAAPGWYVNPVVSQNLRELAESATKKSGMPVIVSVYHLGALQKTAELSGEADQPTTSHQEASIQQQREALDRHFQLLAELRAQKVLYPITLRELLEVINRQASQAAPVDESK